MAGGRLRGARAGNFQYYHAPPPDAIYPEQPQIQIFSNLPSARSGTRKEGTGNLLNADTRVARMSPVARREQGRSSHINRLVWTIDFAAVLRTVVSLIFCWKSKVTPPKHVLMSEDRPCCRPFLPL